MSFADISAKLGTSEEESLETIDDYLKSAILRPGYLLKCSECRQTAWYGLDDFGTYFKCIRCGTGNMTGPQSWLGGTSPTLHYDLAEVVLQALKCHAEVPILALSDLAVESSSFLFCSELQLLNKSGEEEIEIDILAILDGRIILGEAKSTDKLQSSKRSERRWLNRFLEVGAEIGVDEYVFATSMADWSERTREAIDGIVGKGRHQYRTMSVPVGVAGP